MLDHVIRFSLRNRLFVVASAALLLVYGSWVLLHLPVDVFPDLNRPTVTIMTEAGGLSPEEVEALVTRPIEVAMNGAAGVKRVRSSTGIGLSVVYVEFDWGTDIYLDRQLVAERLQVAREKLPAGTSPVLAPISSIMGEILLLGVQSEGNHTAPMQLRTLSDWVLRQRILTIPGVAQVTVLGGGVQQYQVLVEPARLHAYGATLAQVEAAVRESQRNTTGGFLVQQGQESLIRNLASSASIEDLRATPVLRRDGVTVTLGQVAKVQLGVQTMRGDGGVNGKPAVILAIQKQPGANTIELTTAVLDAVTAIQKTLPRDVRIHTLFRQATFIESAVQNVALALRDGAVLVVIVLLLFLMNLRTTAITLTAIPLSFIATALVMKALGVSINTMTLGGLAVAIGELVDDAIVDVENVHRRLRENRARPDPQPVLEVIWRASSEVRNSIVFATILVVLVFVPLFAMGGIEGRLFIPLGIAYIVSITASLVVSLTVTPALCAYLLGSEKTKDHAEQDGFLVRWLKRLDTRVLAVTLEHPGMVMTGAALLVLAALAIVPTFGREFMPPFNEGTATINVLAKPGTSLEQSNAIGNLAERLLMAIPEVATVGRRTGRAEQDEHAEGVHYSEIDVDFKATGRPREQVLAQVRHELGHIPGVSANIGQPISHRLDHLLSGIRAQLAVKLFGEDMTVLRAKAEEIRAVMAQVPGIVDLQVEQQVLIPQVRIQVRRQDAARYGLAAGALTETLETALNGKVVGQVLDGQRTFDLMVRLDEASRADLAALRRVLVDTPDGARIPLSNVADIEDGTGPNLINHDNIQRRIVVMANTAARDLGSVVDDVQGQVAAKVKLPAGYFLAYEGQFESQKSATRLISLLALFSLSGMFLVLYAHFRSVRLVLQVMLNIPLALIGSVGALLLTDRTFSIATLVGFITLCGIASRNTIMMISHYIHLVQVEGEKFDRHMIVRGSLERLVPVLMTALTASLALVPLVMAKGEPGKEILYPVAVVILGGLTSSTLLDMIVTPAVFYRFGRPAVEKYLIEHAEQAAAASSHESAADPER
jgi:CzcA family heavy metal efflux pump